MITSTIPTQARQAYEDARLLYVAATRARKTLRLIGHADVKENKGERSCKPKSGSLLHHLWPLARQDYQQALPRQSEPDQEQSHSFNQDTRRLSPAWTPPAPPPGVQLARAAGG